MRLNFAFLFLFTNLRGQNLEVFLKTPGKVRKVGKTAASRGR
jgi:hypothetical protein